MTDPEIFITDELAGADPLTQRQVINRLRSEGHLVVTDSARQLVQFLAADDAEYLLTSRDFGAAVAMGMLALAGVHEGPLHDLWSEMMFGKDGEEHDRIRRTVARRFTGRAMARHRPAIERVADDLLDTCPTTEPVDLWDTFAIPLVAQSACAVVGFPLDDAAHVGSLAARVSRAFGLMTPDVVGDTATAAEALVAYVRELIESGGVVDGSILADLLADDDLPLSASEVRALAANLVFGGLDSTAKAITTGLVLLQDHHGAWDRLVADPAVVAPGAAAEALRFLPPASAVLRMATEETRCAGVTVPANTLVAANLDAVCRDPELFERPDDFDIDRDPGRHFAFGAGPHYCLGAHLALLVIEVAFATLARRHPVLRLAEPVTELTWTADPFRGPVPLRVILGPPQA